MSKPTGVVVFVGDIALHLLRDDPKARVAFVDQIAAPVLNKMFECNMIP